MAPIRVAFDQPRTRGLAADDLHARAQRLADTTALCSQDLLLTHGAVAAFSVHTSGQTAAMEIIVAPALLLRSEGVSYQALGPIAALAAPEAKRLSAEVLCHYWRQRAHLQNFWFNVVLFERAQARVAFLLHVLADVYSARTVPVRLSYERLALLCGISWRSVERCVGAWVRRGLVERRSCHYTILEPELLAEEIGDGIGELDVARVRRAGSNLIACASRLEANRRRRGARRDAHAVHLGRSDRRASGLDAEAS